MPAVACSASILMESSQYPDLEHVVSTEDSEHTPSRSRGGRILSRLLLFALAFLAIVSLVSILVAWSILSHKEPGRTRSIWVAQVLDLIASAFSILYILLHSNAAFVQTDTPLVSKLCKGRLVLARLTSVAWLICVVVTPVLLANTKACLPATKVCRLQIADMVASSVGLISICLIWITLEFCKQPFGTANILPNRTSTVRIGVFTSLVDLLGHFSTSHASRAPKYTQRLLRKPLATRHSYHSDEALPQPLTPVLPRQQQSSRGWGDEWIHLLRDTSTSPRRNRRSLPKLDSGFSVASKLSGSSGESSKSTSFSPSSTPRRCQKCRYTEVVTTSSSISYKLHRVPLSTVRSAERPNVPIRAELKYSPPAVSSHKLRVTTSATMPSVPATADIHGRYQRSSLTLIPVPLMIRTVDNQLLQPRASVLPALVRRKTVEIKVPGAYLDSAEHRPSSSDEKTHDRNISGQPRSSDAEYVSRIPSKRSRSRCPNRRPVGGVQKRSSVPSVSSCSRYREQRPVCTCTARP